MFKKPQKKSRDRDWAPYMEQVLEQARIAEDKGDVRIGALVVNRDGKVIAKAYNQRELKNDPTAHAECLALQEASQVEKSWRLWGCTLVVNLEPCVMCAGALSLARVDRVVFGAFDNSSESKTSAIEMTGGIMGDECEALINDFFRKMRLR